MSINIDEEKSKLCVGGTEAQRKIHGQIKAYN